MKHAHDFFPDLNDIFGQFDVSTKTYNTSAHSDEDIEQTESKDGTRTTVLTLEVPGLTNEQVKVGVRPDKLKVDWTDRKGRKHEREYNIKSTYSTVQARVRDGLLTVTLVFPPEKHTDPAEFRQVATE